MSTNAKKKQKIVEKGGVDWLDELSVYEMNETKKTKKKFVIATSTSNWSIIDFILHITKVVN